MTSPRIQWKPTDDGRAWVAETERYKAWIRYRNGWWLEVVDFELRSMETLQLPGPEQAREVGAVMMGKARS
jgi:hypothetical protein